MAGTARPKSPGGPTPADNVRQLQNRLWAAAKKSPGRRFHALYDRIYRSDVLEVPVSFGFRPKRSATDALERIRVAFPQGQQFVFEADIENFFRDRAPKFAGGPRILAQTLERISLCAALRQNQQAGLSAFLRRY